jgi:hypothetical protein
MFMKVRFVTPLVLAPLVLVTTAMGQTLSTPAYNGSGAAVNNYTNYQVSTNFNSALGQNPGTALGNGTNNGTVMRPGTNALGQPATALGQTAPAIGQPGSNALGQQNTTAIGQQGTTAIGQQGSGTAIIPPGTVAVGNQATNGGAGTITNGYIVNGDGSVTALPGAGSTALTPGGTNSGAGASQTNSFQTNRFRNP